jgi:flavin reductase (DIM6/NTAB) family NADH-FMN oxidoreductase RutF
MARFATGVTILTTEVEGRIMGMTANAITSVSLDPPLVLASVAASSSWRLAVRASSFYSIHVLAADQGELARWCASPSRHDDPDRLPRLLHVKKGRACLLGSLATIHCSIYAEYPAGDHDLLIGEVVATEAVRGGRPLVFADHSFGDFSSRSRDRVSSLEPVAFPVADPFPGWTTPVAVHAAS